MQTSDSDQRLAKGTIVGPYEIIRLLGKGGMGEVYEAYEAKLFRKVALKIISEEVKHNTIVLEHFISEGRTLAQLNHPNVVTIYQLGEDNGIQFIAMEYIEGESLDELIESKLPSVPEAIFIFYKILSGVLALHNKGVIHRDLKPKNIMVPNPKTIKIVDFGIAEFIVNNPASKEGNNIPKGSIYYLAPEILEGRPATVQSDIWSLGVIFYNLLTGLKPFVGGDRSEIKQSILRGRIYYPMSKRMGIPNNIIKIISKMCHQDINKRYKSIEEIITDLKTKTEQPKSNLASIAIAVALAFLTTLPLVWQWSNISSYKKIPISTVKEEPKEATTIVEPPPKIISISEPKVEEPVVVQTIETPETKPKALEIVEVKKMNVVTTEKVSKALKAPVVNASQSKWLIQFKKNMNSRGIASLENLEQSEPRLTWKKVIDATSYRLQVAQDKSFKDIVLDQEVNKNSFSWQKPKLGNFFWRVQALAKDKKASPYSRLGQMSIKVPPPIVENKTIKVRLESASPKKVVRIQWLEMNLVSAYEVHLIPIEGVFQKAKLISAEASVSIPVSKRSKFKAKIFALDDKRMPASNEAAEVFVDVEDNIFIPSPVLVYPLTRTIVPSQSTMITPIVCKWNLVKSATKYVYQISEDKEGKEVLNEVTLTENKIVLTLPLSKGEYFWRVKAITTDGHESSWSKRFSFIID